MRIAITTILVAPLVLLTTTAPAFAQVDVKTRLALDLPVSVEFVDTPLKDAMGYLRQVTKVPIDVDEKALREVGIPMDEPLNAVFEGISLRSTLNLLLEPLSLRAVPLEAGELMITTTKVAEKRMETQQYDLRRVFGAEPIDNDGLLQAIESGTSGRWLNIDAVGGQLKVDGTKLIVEQSAKVQHEIGLLLIDVTRRLNPQQAPPLSFAELNEAGIRLSLQTPATADWVNFPLTDAVDYTGQMAQTLTLLDEQGLRDAGLQVDVPLNQQANQQPLAEFLDDALAAHKLTWIIEDEALKIMTQNEADEHMRAAVFDIRPQIKQDGGPQPIIDRIQQLPGKHNWETIDGIGGRFNFVSGLLVVRQSRPAMDAIESLMAR